MNNNKKISNILVFYSLLFSGICFFGIPSDGENSFSSFIFATVAFFIVYFLAKFYIHISAKANITHGAANIPKFAAIAVYFLLFIAFVCLYCVFTGELSDTLPVISKEFEGGRFSHFFVILSLFLALYIGKREFTSYSRICLLCLPLLILPYVLTAFDFIGYNADILSMLPKFDLSFKPMYLANGFVICAGISAVLIIINEKSESNFKVPGLGWAFILFAVSSAVELIKHILWFGSYGLEFVLRPDRTMLAQVPYINVQELFLVSYYISYILKISVCCAAARLMLQKAVKKITGKESVSVVFAYGMTAAAAYGFYAVYRGISGDGLGIIPAIAAQFVIFAVIILHELARILLKKRRNDRGGAYPRL